ncbi:MAG: spermidine synthase [Brevundimonas sp.]|uniref:spermidine synthase n=1 Tax=Brevundimonas sp. TaxID=1871086 RepID=UPI003918DF25
MTDNTTEAEPIRTGLRQLNDPVIPVLFGLTVFMSAALVFVVQPMVTKLILPSLGGSPAVWNTSMVFFQGALLAGYAYAHLLQRIRSLQAQVVVHLALLAIAALFLPLQVSGLLGEPDPGAPITWLLLTLAVSIGAPFAVLSATAPLMQAWYARVRVNEPDGKNPYVLYAASNLGSFLALLSYPVLIEPFLTLSGQRIGWSLGYGLFAALVVLLLFAVWKRRGQAGGAAPLAATSPISWRARGLWVLLAAAPSSLMLGVTAHLSTDVASAPFLWVIPLALYLLTFVIAFQARPWIPMPVTFLVQAALVAAMIGMMPFQSGEWAFMFLVHIAAFFFTALMCHQILAARRPPPDRLTEFYLLLSLGGVLGGIFSALIAPVVFDVVREYPLVLVLTALLRPWGQGPFGRSQWALLLAIAPLTAGPPLLYAALRNNPELLAVVGWETALSSSRLAFLAAGICAFLIRDRALLFTAALIMISLSAHHVAERYDFRYTERSFFGVMRVAEFNDPGMGGPVHMMMHGTTLHGAQARDLVEACQPSLYYAPSTPIGQVADAVQHDRPAASIGVIGLGAGAMAGYRRTSDDMTFFEIDPMVDRVARDPRWFTYISDCAQGPVTTVLGDARLTLAREPDNRFDLLLVDAFSSDAIPTHLLTREAIAEYLRVVKDDGVVVLHLSNRHLELAMPTVNAARQLGAFDRHQIFIEREGLPVMAEASTEVLILSPTEDGMALFADDPRWRVIAPNDVRAWTDDYVNVVGAIMREMRFSRGG